MYGQDMYRFPELLDAHEANDAAVMAAYGFRQGLGEADIAEELFRLYGKWHKRRNVWYTGKLEVQI